MRLGDSTGLDLVEKIRSWFSWDSELVMSESNRFCCESGSNAGGDSVRYHCLGCDRDSCEKCTLFGSKRTVAVSGSDDGRVRIKCCRFCQGKKKHCEKVHPRDSPEPPSPCFSGSKGVSLMPSESVQSDCITSSLEAQERVVSPRGVSSSNMSDSVPHPPLISVRCSPMRYRSDEEETEESGKHFFSPSGESSHDISDIDTTRSFRYRNEFSSFRSGGSDSPSRITFSRSSGNFVQREQDGSPIISRGSPSSYSQEALPLAVLKKPGADDAESTDYCSDDLSIFQNQYQGNFQKPLDFENNQLIWFPPPANDEEDDMESNFFEYDDDEDDVGDSGAMFTSSSSLSCIFPAKERKSEGSKEPLRSLVQVHFRALVSQLLYGEDVIKMETEDGSTEWVDIVTSVAWQAASYVKPDTSKGGSMDPCDYVKVKCVASGSPNESTLVKGVVCTKNVKHKRMTSQYKNPRILILGGALEYQRVPNQLASFDTLLQQENDHLKMIISKIESLHPNVLLVEKSVSSYAQGYLLENEISLVLNVKRPLLDRISKCTGASVTPSIDNISTTRLGHCELFRLERVTEEYEVNNQRKPSKTLMFFEGCPRRLGCTVLLRGASREELKKIKHVVQYAVFAAYHLSLETSFLADEGASLPKMSPRPSIALPEQLAPDYIGVSDERVMNIHDQEEGSDSADEDTQQHDVVPRAPSNTALSHSSLSSRKDEMLIYDAYDSDSVLANNVVESKDSHFHPPEFVESMTGDGENEISSEYFSAADTNQSILVSFSSRCVVKGTVCERSRLQRIKFYGCFDKPLGRYLRDDLFDQICYCRSCKEPAEAHVLCYTHQQGNLTVNVKRILSLKLSGAQDGKIWMWHRCLKCAQVNGVPPAAPRVVMSDAAWGLSFGKFLELSFSNHATANRVATCGHSLQRDCLRYYGCGSMVAFFRYSPIDILTVCLPPSVLDFDGPFQQEWLRKEAAELYDKMETLYMEISRVLDTIQQKSDCCGHQSVGASELHSYIFELKDLLKKERDDYNEMLELADTSRCDESSNLDILELNRIQRSLVIGSRVWDRRLCSLDLLLETHSPKAAKRGNSIAAQLKALRDETPFETTNDVSSHHLLESSKVAAAGTAKEDEDVGSSSDEPPNLSERIDSAWTGGGENESPSFRRLMAPMRVHSFDSALRVRDRIKRGLPPSSLHLSALGSFHASGEYRNMVRDPVSTTNVMRTYSQMLPRDAQRLSSSLISPVLSLGARLLLPQTGRSDIVVAVYDDDPTSIISYALSSKEYEDWVLFKSDEEISSSGFSGFQSFTSLDTDHYSSNYDDAASLSSFGGALFRDPPKKSPHFRVSFEDESSPGSGKMKFSVTCYFAKQFESLRWKCCPSEIDFVRSLSRCRRWSAQGGKSNVYFAKSMDERFIIKQVTKTELDSFEDFSCEYFKYLSDSLSSGSPTCLAKVFGMYQVSVKHVRGGKETKMDVMVMENLFYKRNISRVYDLKGSLRSRYNADTTGKDKVLLDLNLLEALRTKPMFLGSKAKRNLERSIWNDTAFLACVDVMDYSLLVGVDDESNELVVGIIDYMRQYTWDKHLETWVKAAGILGGPKNASPTIVSPKQYKKRFRKAMTTYFLTVPDQWSDASAA